MKDFPLSRIQQALCAAAVVVSALQAPPVLAQGAPKVVSVTPANGSTDASPDTSIVFVFDQPMDTMITPITSFPPFVVGNFEVTPANRFVTGTWSQDGLTLTLGSSLALPLNTQVSWTLNPMGSLLPFANPDGTPLATTSGSFRVGATSGGEDPCNQGSAPPTFGSYTLTKNAAYLQTSTADPLPTGSDPFMFGVSVTSPSAGPSITGGSVTKPDNTILNLQGFSSTYGLFNNQATEAALQAEFPDGAYTLRFTQTSQPERVIPMTIPTFRPPVPKITNYQQAQAVDSAQDFLIQWIAFTGATATDYINLTVSDTQSRVVFQAPNPCIGRELPATATSVVIPANTLVSNRTYQASITFSRVFYFSTNTVPSMVGYGTVTRNTQFTIHTGGGGVPTPPGPANFTGFRLLPAGDPELDVTGTPTRLYTIERTSDIVTPNWSAAGNVTLDATGHGVFQDTSPGRPPFPLFYRTVGN